MKKSADREVWLKSKSGASLCALIHGDRGWLMFLPEPGEPGFSSRNPDYDGPPKAVIAYTLSNGQVDQYPASWALPLAVVERAMKHFQKSGTRAPFVTWKAD